MGATPTPKPTARPADTPNPCDAALADLSAQAGLDAILARGPAAGAPCLGLAFSGGADSTALLEAARRRWPTRVLALHVNHGLQAAAADFETHVRHQCAHWQVALDVCRVEARPGAGESPEDAARRARYRALAERAQALGLGAVLLAQHADDQVETLLLALSRGAGVPGLAAMPVCFQRHGMRFVRPLLQISGPALRDWLRQHRVDFVEDPSNGDPAYTRNRIRQRVLPALEALGPWRQTFLRSIRHLAQAQHLLDELAAQDWAAMGGRMQIAGLQALGPERQANVLRHWLRQSHGVAPSAAQLQELQQQLRHCRTRGHQIRIKLGPGEVRREDDVLAWYNR